MLIFWSEHHGNAVKKAKGSLWLRKLKVDALRALSRTPTLPVPVLAPAPDAMLSNGIFHT